jgi:hypothetical protein
LNDCADMAGLPPASGAARRFTIASLGISGHRTDGGRGGTAPFNLDRATGD